MSKIIEQAMKIHQEAMSFSDEAQIAQFERAGKSRVLDFLKKAFELEEEAAMLLIDEKDDLVTRTVLFRGAAVLALDCNKLSEAERLIEHGLSEEAPSQLADELRDLKSIVYERRTELRKVNLLKDLPTPKKISVLKSRDLPAFIIQWDAVRSIPYQSSQSEPEKIYA